jgi:hypothetical protein
VLSLLSLVSAVLGCRLHLEALHERQKTRKGARTAVREPTVAQAKTAQLASVNKCCRKPGDVLSPGDHRAFDVEIG